MHTPTFTCIHLHDTNTYIHSHTTHNSNQRKKDFKKWTRRHAGTLLKKNIIHHLYLKQGSHTRSCLWFLSALQSHVRQEETPQYNMAWQQDTRISKKAGSHQWKDTSTGPASLEVYYREVIKSLENAKWSQESQGKGRGNGGHTIFCINEFYFAWRLHFNALPSRRKHSPQVLPPGEPQLSTSPHATVLPFSLFICLLFSQRDV